MKNLASAEIQLGKNEEAEALIRGALNILQKHSGDESFPVADMHRDLSTLLGNEGRWAGSAEEAKKALAIRTNILGPKDPSVAAALNDLAWAYTGGGALEQAESLERQALKIRQRVLDQNDPDLAESLYLVGDCLRKRGKLMEAEGYLNQALAVDHKLTGDAHLFLVETLYSLGMTLQSEGRFQDSENMFADALNLGLKPNLPRVLSTRRNLLQVLIAEKKFDAAVGQLNLILTPNENFGC